MTARAPFHRILIAGSALALFGLVAYSCAPFETGNTSSGSSGDVGEGGVLMDGAARDASGEEVDGGAGPACAFEKILTEPFNSGALPDWQRQVSAQGTFEVIQIENDGPTPKHDSYATLSGALGGEFNARDIAIIRRSFTRNVKAAKVTFDLAHRKMGNKTDFGCRLVFSGAKKTASAMLRYEGSQNLVFDALVTSEGVPEEGIASKVTLAQLFPVNQWRTVTIDLELVVDIDGGQIAAGVTIDNVRTTIPRFPFGAPTVESVTVACGIEYMEPQNPLNENRMSEVALDELVLSTCQ